MYLGRNTYYYLAHPLTSFGDIEKNRENEQICYETIREKYPDVVILRPLTLIPENFTDDEAMSVCVELLSSCDAVIFCSEWKHSAGCVAEYEFARANGLEVIDIKEITLNDEVIDLTENKMEVR